MDPWLLLPRILLFLDTLRPREKDGSEGVAPVCSGFCVGSWVSGLLANTGLFLSTGNKYLLPLTPISQFRFFITAPESIFSGLASKFRNRSF